MNNHTRTFTPFQENLPQIIGQKPAVGIVGKTIRPSNFNKVLDDPQYSQIDPTTKTFITPKIKYEFYGTCRPSGQDFPRITQRSSRGSRVTTGPKTTPVLDNNTQIAQLIDEPKKLQVVLQNKESCPQCNQYEQTLKQLQQENQMTLKLEQKIDQLNKEINNLKENESIKNLKLQELESEVLSFQNKYYTIETEKRIVMIQFENLQKERQQLENEMNGTTGMPLKEKIKKIHELSSTLEKMKLSQYQMSRLLQCKLCNKNLTRTVTVIPCAHSYCLECKKGYTKVCYICGTGMPIEVAYENTYMDQIQKMFNYLCQCLEILDVFK